MMINIIKNRKVYNDIRTRQFKWKISQVVACVFVDSDSIHVWYIYLNLPYFGMGCVIHALPEG